MSSPLPVTHIINKKNYTQHKLVTLPSVADDLSPLAPSSLRLRTKIIGLTTNNLTYARLGHVMGWHFVYPLGGDVGGRMRGEEEGEWVRIAAWGYAEVIDSTFPSIPIHTTLYGFLPISTEHFTLTMTKTPHPNQFHASDPHRQLQHLGPYNRYQHLAPLDTLYASPAGEKALAYAALMQPLFATAWNLNNYVFKWSDEDEDRHGNGDDTLRARVHPSGNASHSWTRADADLAGSVCVFLNASSKTALSFAYTLRKCRPRVYQPRHIIGVSSSASRAVLERGGAYDELFLNEEAEVRSRMVIDGDWKGEEGIGRRRIVLFDFGAREGVAGKWYGCFSSTEVSSSAGFENGIEVMHFGVGTAPIPHAPSLDALAAQRGSNNRVQVNASAVREHGIAVDGARYFDEFYKGWDAWVETGGLGKGLDLEWGEGLEGWEKGWEGYCRDKVGAEKGMVYRI